MFTKKRARPKARGELVGWSSSKFPCELAAAFDLHVMYPENQAAGIAANRYGEMMCQAAERIWAMTTISADMPVSALLMQQASAYPANTILRQASIIDPSTGKPLKDADGNVVMGEDGKPVKGSEDTDSIPAAGHHSRD